MIVLRSWTNDRTFVVVVILIADIPIQTAVKPDREPRFWRLVTIRVRGNQSARVAGWNGDTIILASVFVDSIRRKQTYSREQQRSRINEEEVVSDNVETATLWMLDIIEKVVDDRIAIDPVVVISGVD